MNISLTANEIERHRKRFEKFFIPEPMSGCWLWLGGSGGKKPYGLFTIKNKNCGAHRAAWMFYVGELPESLMVLHKCDNPACVNPQHLFLGTHFDNMKDMTTKNRHARQGPMGEAHPRHILREADILKIRSDTRLHKIIAKSYGVAKTTISALKRGQSWKWVK